MIDSFYTPPFLAKKLIDFVRTPKVNRIADFCIGDGELLRAAAQRWPKAQFVGSDLSEKAIRQLKKKKSNWKVGKCDFLNANSTKRCKAINNLKKTVDLVLLNPPFSCIGGRVWNITLDNQNYSVSTAMAFVVKAMSYLSNEGAMYAILPNSVAYSEKDRKIWAKLTKDYQLKILEESTDEYFNNSACKTIMVSIKCPYTLNKQILPNFIDFKIQGMSIFRGKVSMHEIKSNQNGSFYFLHTTNIKRNKIVDLKIKSSVKLSLITGPAVLIPRVGQVTKEKLAIMDAKYQYVISDCILAIKTRTHRDAINLKNLLIQNWTEVVNLYKGTGARYVTVEKLRSFLLISNNHPTLLDNSSKSTFLLNAKKAV